MFEKEAEEYADGKGHEHYNYLFEENTGSPATFANWCFKDGAEFGYNKANEWHYPSKGELPKCDEKTQKLDYDAREKDLTRWFSESLENKINELSTRELEICRLVE